MNIRISRLHFPVTTLGPGRRIGIWFQGCSIHCPGCISADTWSTNADQTTVAALLTHISPWLNQAEGITISGGEPFDQAKALLILLENLRKLSKLDILVYSGYPLASLTSVLNRAEGLIDALISEPFEAHAPHSYPLRGSDNQKLHFLTALGRERFSQYERPLADHDKSLDVMFDQDGTVWFAGIPRKGDFQRLQKLLIDQGHSIHTSVAKDPDLSIKSSGDLKS